MPSSLANPIRVIFPSTLLRMITYHASFFIKCIVLPEKKELSPTISEKGLSSATPLSDSLVSQDGNPEVNKAANER